MKNARLSLLVLSVFAFQNIESKNQKQDRQQNQVRPKSRTARRELVQQQAIEPRIIETKVSQTPLSDENNKSFIDTQVIRNPENDTVTEKIITVTVNPEENIVTTEEKTSTWSWADYAKLAAGIGIVAGAGYLAYQNNQDFAGKVDAAGAYASKQTKGAYEFAGNKLADAQKYVGESATGAQEKYNNWRSGTIAQDNSATLAAPAEEEQSMGAEINVSDTAPASSEVPVAGADLGAPVDDQAVNDVRSAQSFWSRVPMMTQERKDFYKNQRAEQNAAFTERSNRNIDDAKSYIQSKVSSMPNMTAQEADLIL